MIQKRPAKIHVGIGSRLENKFEGIEMDFNEIHIFDDKNYTYYSDVHPQMDGIMFWDKHPQPSNDQCLGNILQQNYGHMNAEFLFTQAAPLHETGNAQVVVYDFENETVYLSYSDPATETMAYNRPLVKLNMTELLNSTNFF